MNNKIEMKISAKEAVTRARVTEIHQKVYFAATSSGYENQL